MGKYTPIKDYLETEASLEITLNFEEIEEILGADLPSSAYKYNPWWSNNPWNNTMTNEWLAAGYYTKHVDVTSQQVTFCKGQKSTHVPLSDVGAPEKDPLSPPGFGEALMQPPIAAQPLAHTKLFGALKGSFALAPDVDLTKPALPEWAGIADAKWDTKNGELE